MYTHIIARAAVFCLVLVTISIRTVASQDDSPVALVTNDCENKLNFKTIEEFLSFMSLFKGLNPEDHPDLKPNNPFKRCLNDREALIALEELVVSYDRKRPCKFDEIAKLETYARRFFLEKKKRPISLKFFTLFGVNIGFYCKLNLLANVKQADLEADQLDFIYSIASPTGWDVLINEFTKKSIKFGSSSHSGNNVINRVAKLIPGLKQIDQLNYLSFDHALNRKQEKVEAGSFEVSTPETATKIVESLEKIVESCKNLDQLYLNSILSLARLSELGLVVNFDILNDQHEQSLMLHRWMAATSFCQLMVRVKVSSVPKGGKKLKFEVVHDDKLLEGRRVVYTYVAEFSEIAQQARDGAWLAGVLEGKWKQAEQAMFRPDEAADRPSLAMNQLRQFIKGLAHDHEEALRSSEDL